MIDDTVLVAAILLIGVVASLAMTRLSTRLTIALVGTILTLAVWSVLNLIPFEVFLHSWVPGISTVLKSLVLMNMILLGNLFLDAMGKNYARPIRWIVPIPLAGLKIHSWASVLDQCADLATGHSLIFTHCAHSDARYAAVDIAVNVAVFLMVVAIITVLWPLANSPSRVGQTMTFFLVEAFAALIWLIIASIGICQVHANGHLPQWQYIVRPTLAIIIVLLNVVAVLYLPTHAALDALVFRRQVKPLSVALSGKTPGPDIQTGNLTTRTMDHLGISLEAIEAPVHNSASDEDALATARWLKGQGNPPTGAPISEPVWMQRSWLLTVVRMLKS